MGKGSYEDVGKQEDFAFMDPTGNYARGMDRFSNAANAQAQFLGPNGAYDPNAYMNQFMGQSAGLANIAQGATAPLGQSLNALAARSAALGGEQALAAMPGSRNSGAGMAAFGQAYADPFAQAAAQTQQAQLGLTGQLWNQAMGGNLASQQAASQQYQNMLGQYGQMAVKQGEWYQPTYEYQKGGWDYAMDVGNLALGVGSMAMGLPPINFGGSQQPQYDASSYKYNPSQRYY